MPFSNDRCFIPILLKHLRKRQQISIEVAPIDVFVKPIDVAELARQNGRTTWATNAICAIHLVHSNAVVCNAINVWRGCQFCKVRAVCTDCLISVIIGHDIDYIQWLCLGILTCFALARPQGQGKKVNCENSGFCGHLNHAISFFWLSHS